MNPRHLDRDTRRLKEKRGDTRKRTQKEFISSLEIVKDHKKIKNIRKRQGVPGETKEEREAYGRAYHRIYGRSGAKPGSTGHYVWDPVEKRLVKVSDEIPSSTLVTL